MTHYSIVELMTALQTVLGSKFEVTCNQMTGVTIQYRVPVMAVIGSLSLTDLCQRIAVDFNLAKSKEAKEELRVYQQACTDYRHQLRELEEKQMREKAQFCNTVAELNSKYDKLQQSIQLVFGETDDSKQNNSNI